MTIDERLQFLLQSTESLHATAQEITAGVQELRVLAQEHTKQLQQDGEHIRALVRIAEIHQHRLDDLEGRGTA